MWYQEQGFAGDFEILQSDNLRSQLSTGKLPSGVYSLDDLPHRSAYIQYYSKAIVVSDDDFQALWNYGMENVPRSPNPMNTNTFIKRRYATFGSNYRFGRQSSLGIMGEEDSWPIVIQAVLADARARSSNPKSLTVVHTNWYPDGTAGLQPHQDDETIFIPGMPIYSYTLLSNPNLPRSFQIYRIPDTTPTYDIPLGHGDLLIMAGDTQKRYKHGVKSIQRVAYKELKRINMTVRSLRGVEQGLL
jgi:alkylated DNA repair dioxygenase AlkB